MLATGLEPLTDTEIRMSMYGVMAPSAASEALTLTRPQAGVIGVEAPTTVFVLISEHCIESVPVGPLMAHIEKS